MNKLEMGRFLYFWLGWAPALGFSSCSSLAPEYRLSSCLVACGIFQGQGSNCCPCILDHCSTREAQKCVILNELKNWKKKKSSKTKFSKTPERGQGVVFIFSLSIECIQGIWHIGFFELNDVLNNIIGAMLGTLFHVLCSSCKKCKKRTEGYVWLC